MTLLLRFWPYLAIAAALVGAYLWLDHRSYQRGYDAKNAEVIAAANALAAKADRVRVVIDQQAAAIAAGQQRQTIETREIRNEVVRIVDRPVYRSTCLDADGVRLLDRAIASASFTPPGLSDDAATGAAAVPAQ